MRMVSQSLSFAPLLPLLWSEALTHLDQWCVYQSVIGHYWSELWLVAKSCDSAVSHRAAGWVRWHSWCRASAGSLPSRRRSPGNGRWSAGAARGGGLLLLLLHQHPHLAPWSLRWWCQYRTGSWRRPAAAGRSPTPTTHTVARCRGSRGRVSADDITYILHLMASWWNDSEVLQLFLFYII